MIRSNIDMMKLDTSKKVTLSNGRTFYVKCKRGKRSALSPTIPIQKILKKKKRKGEKVGKKHNLAAVLRPFSNKVLLLLKNLQSWKKLEIC